MARLMPYLQAGTWLPSTHPCVGGAPRSRSKGDDQALSEYIALSAVQHAFDGWAYWGRAVAAEVSGDSNIASHLGYYAELRAAKAILASEGIGLSGSWVAVVDANGLCELKRGQGNAHRVLWDTLTEWSRGKAQDIVFQLLMPFGHSIADWLGQFSRSSSPVAENWLRTWGLDLRELARDGSSRNVASYEPSGCPQTDREKSEKALSHIMRLWRSCEPTGPGVDLALDRLVLRSTLETVFQNSHPYRRSARQAHRQYDTEVRRAVGSLPFGRPRSEAIQRFLNPRKIPAGMEIFETARRQNDVRSATHVTEVLSRALLLLRLATACVHDLLAEFGSDSRSVTRQWWESRHVRRGLWPKGHTLHSFSDLWDEADEALETLRRQKSGMSTFTLRSPECAGSIATLATAERIFLWGSFAA